MGYVNCQDCVHFNVKCDPDPSDYRQPCDEFAEVEEEPTGEEVVENAVSENATEDA